MEKRRGRRLIGLSLMIVLALSAYLRLSGIGWGLKSGYGHLNNFHPDEFISIRGMLPIRPLAGQLRSPDAYFEGTFNYYLWTVPEMFRELHDGERQLGGDNLPPAHIEFILLSGRLMSVVFDLVTVLLLFAIITELTGQPVAAILGALLYGVIPMQVIYSHFMRTHTLSNLLCVVVIWLALQVLKHRHWWLFIITGVAAGLAAATRYPAALILSVPCLLVLFQAGATNEPWPQRFGKSFVYLLSGPLWLLAAGFLVGLFLGEPMLFLDFRSVLPRIIGELSHYTPPAARNPFDLRPIWRHVYILIPYATYPILWLLIYLSVFYVILRPSLWPIVIPLCLFVVLYTYSMAKGYLDAFARQTMLLMPVFCILVGLACGQIFPKLLKRPRLFRLVMIVMLLLIFPSILFDWAYGRAMKRRDVRELLRNDLRDLIKDRSATTIAVSGRGCYFYTAMPAVLPLRSSSVAVELESSLVTPADFFVIGFEKPLAENSRNFAIRWVESGGAYRFMKTYIWAPTVLGKTFDLSNFPPDMTYPFPTILLFRRVTSP